MIGQIFKSVLCLCFYAVIFVALVWVLLGISPSETYTRTKTNLTRLMGSFGSFSQDMAKTAGDMKAAGDKQLEDANARFHGRDPDLERVDNMLKQETKAVQ